jgi:peptidoglycan-associated lipoprotein
VKKLVLISVGAALLLFTGCSKKTPEVDMTKKSEMNANQSAKSADTKVSGMSNSMDTSSEQTVNNMNSNGNDVNYKIAQLEQKTKIIHFDFDKYNIREDQKPLVEEDANIVNSDDAKDFSVKLEGNTDEWGTDEYNYALGLRRAKSVKSALVTLGVDANRLMIISYGESNPVCTEHNKACWAKNRRVEFKFLP